jgi:hypothetical protein
MPAFRVSLDSLYERFDAIAKGRARGDGRAAHQAVLDRLAANRRAAEAHGWTACAIERAAGMGQMRLWGVPPSGDGRQVVPDWSRQQR